VICPDFMLLFNLIPGGVWGILRISHKEAERGRRMKRRSAGKKKLPIGIESFEEIRTEGFYYVVSPDCSVSSFRAFSMRRFRICSAIPTP